MKKKTNRKSRSVQPLRSLPEATVNTRTAKRVKGGESTLNFGKIEWKYTEQK